MASSQPSGSGSSSAAKAGASAAGGGEQVTLRVYDLSQGMARQLSMSFLGKQVDGIWHTGVVVFGKEYFYGGGIQIMDPAEVVRHFGMAPVQEIPLGRTQIDKATLREYLRGLRPQFTPEKYDLFHNNCNNFSDTVSKFLLGTGIPAHIINLPNEVLATPIGQMLKPVITQMQQSMYGDLDPFAALRTPALGSSSNASPALSEAAAATLQRAVELAANNGSLGAGTGAGAAAAAAPAPAAADAADAVEPQLSGELHPLLSSDTSSLDRIVKRLVKAEAIDSAEQAQIEAMCEVLKGGSTASATLSAALIHKLAVLTGKPAFPAMCLLRALVLNPAIATLLAGAAVASVDAILANLSSQKYKQSAALMAYTVISNLSSMKEATPVFTDARLGTIIDTALRDVKGSMVQLKQMAAATLYNLTFALAASSDKPLNEGSVSIACGLLDGLDEEKDHETARRRMLAVANLVKRNKAQATSLLTDLGLADVLTEVSEDATAAPETKQLAAELHSLIKAQ